MSLKEDVVKNFGDDIILTGNAIVDRKSIIIPVSPSLDIVLNGGIPEGSFVVLTGQPKCGKDLAISETVYTPNGPIKMGDIKVGDIVCNASGGTSRVIGVYPQGKKDVYKVTFNDGTTSLCGLEHNWTVSRNNRNTKYFTITLQEIIKEGLYYSDRPKWKIPITKPVYFKQKNKLSIDPYILGCLLGDGGLTQKTPRFTTSDKFIAKKFQRFCQNRGLFFKHISKYDYSINGNVESSTLVKNTLTKDLKKMGLMGKSSHTKFIPTSYKYASIQNRLNLIKGLMDTDGHNDHGKRAEYTSTSTRLIKDVKEVLESLGYSVATKQRTTRCNNKSFISYRLYIHGDDIDRLFSLPRKISGHKRQKPILHRTIKNIEKMQPVLTQCIELDSCDGLFLTNNFIVTHNTTTSLDFAATAQRPEYQGGLKTPREVYYLNIEGRLKKRDLEGIPGLNLDRFHVIGSQQGKILHAEEYLQIAEKIINEIPGSVLIIDSYSALCTEAEITSEMDKMQRADGAKLLAKFCRKVANVIPVNKNIVIGITHLMGNPTGYGAEFKEKSGQAIAYQTDIKLRAKTFKPWTLSADSTQIGQEIEWQVICSALGPPGGNITSYIRYGQGVDKYMEAITLASDMGIIHKGGAWYTLTSLEDKPKFQGAEKVRQYLLENTDAYNGLVKSIKETMGVKC
jgi:RecA/RadA recombinase